MKRRSVKFGDRAPCYCYLCCSKQYYSRDEMWKQRRDAEMVEELGTYDPDEDFTFAETDPYFEDCQEFRFDIMWLEHFFPIDCSIGVRAGTGNLVYIFPPQENSDV